MIPPLDVTTGDLLTYISWVRPDADQPTDRRNAPKFPSLFRALNRGLSDDQLKLETQYTDDPKGGRTIMINDEAGSLQPHWFVIRSDLGDHPM